MTAPKKTILVVQTAFLGDLLLGIAFFKHLRRLFPNHQIALFTRKGIADILLKTELIDSLFEIKKGDRDSYNAHLQTIKNLEIEYIFSLHESVRSALFVWQLKAQHKIAFKKAWNFLFFSQRIKKNMNLPDALRQLQLLAPLDPNLQARLEQYPTLNQPFVVNKQGQLSAPPEWASLSLKDKFAGDQGTWLRLQEKLNLAPVKNKKWVMLFPGSVWATKRWTEEGFVEVGKALQNQNYQVIVMGGPGEEALGKWVADRITNSINLTGLTSIYESAVLMLRSVLCIGNDSASMHLASVVDVPMVSVFGPTVIEFGFRPWSDKAFLVENESLDCRPCGKHGHKECPISTHECMKSISSSDVIQKAQSALKLTNIHSVSE